MKNKTHNMDVIGIPQTAIIEDTIAEKKEKVILKEKEVTKEDTSVVATLSRIEVSIAGIEANIKWLNKAVVFIICLMAFAASVMGYMFFHLDSKIEKAITELNTKIDKVATELNAKIDKVAIEQKQEIQRLEQKIDDMKDQHIIPMKIEIEKIKTKLNIK